jgi:hypothetical protein
MGGTMFDEEDEDMMEWVRSDHPTAMEMLAEIQYQNEQQAEESAVAHDHPTDEEDDMWFLNDIRE